MKKDRKRWCEEFSAGTCTKANSNYIPSLAKERTTILKKEEILELTDRNQIINFLSFYDNETLKSGVIPKHIAVKIPTEERHTSYTCLSSNHKNGQKKCSDYR